MKDRHKSNDRKVGENIQRIARKKGTNGSEVAVICGLDYQAVSKWKRGVKRPKGGELYAISQELGIDLNKLFEGCK